MAGDGDLAVYSKGAPPHTSGRKAPIFLARRSKACAPGGSCGGLDLILVSGLSVALFFGLFILSFGMSALLLPPIFPIVAFFYNGVTVSGWRMATPGMAYMDLEMRTMQGEPVPFLQAAVHAVLFYVTWMFPPLFWCPSSPATNAVCTTFSRM